MHPFTFGIYPGNVVGAEGGLITENPDQPEAILVALNKLQPGDEPFLVRTYMVCIGDGESEGTMPENFVHYTGPNRKLDLVLCY